MRVQKTDVYNQWLVTLKDQNARMRIIAKIEHIQETGTLTGDIKPVGDNISELRFHFGAGYRIYFTTKGDELVLLIAGGSKSSQDKDIKQAKRMLAELKGSNQW